MFGDPAVLVLLTHHESDDVLEEKQGYSALLT
jgi:hypothetical protein